MRLDTHHPSYMPVTRDLSPLKWKVILDWLQDPLYSHSGKPTTNVEETFVFLFRMIQFSYHHSIASCSLMSLSLPLMLRNIMQTLHIGKKTSH